MLRVFRTGRATCVAVLTALVLVVGPAVGIHQASAATGSGGIGFGNTTVVDDQRLAGEPDIHVCGPSSVWSYGNCGLNNPYASAPWGFSTTSSYVWRSEDQGRTFKLVPSNDTTGKPDACPGGGDTDLAVSPGTTQSTDFLDFIDLQALTNFSDGVSRNGGSSWTCDAASSFATGVDRQWFGIYKNPAGAPANGSAVYLDYDIANGATAQCALDPKAAGNAFVVQRSNDGGVTYQPFSVVDCNDGIAGNMQVNQTNGHVFAIHTAFTYGATSPGQDSVVVNKSTDGGATWTRSVVFQAGQGACPTECTTGQDFSVLAIDRSGGLYAVWSQAPVDASDNITGPSHIYYSYSANEGATWSPEVQVDTGSTDVNLFPWIVAGKAGAIDVVWYGTTRGVASYDPGSQTTDWYPYLSQSLNANTASPTFSAPVAVSQHPNHNGGICTMGIGCTTGGDRSLADFFQVDVNKLGAAVVIWADTSNNGNNGSNQGATINEAHQINGPSLFGTILSGAATSCASVTATPCQTDVSGDARYEANGLTGANVPKLDITGSSVNVNSANRTQLDVRLWVSNLSSLPNSSDAGIVNPYVDFLTSWNYHIPGNTQANYDSTGNIYYAYLEVNRTTGAVTAYDGNTCSLATTHPKYLVYPGQHAIQYKVNYTNGTIDLYVPRGDVGNPSTGQKLFSVIAHTVDQAGPAGPYDCSARPGGNNQDPSGQVFNVYDKSTAYTAVLGATAS